jgi:hypothetical protein
MALQIRRGPTADRMSYTPVVGELIWDTSTNSLYIGNGSTAGGLPAGTLVTEDVQDIASTMLVNGTHQNITFTYNDTLGRINSTFDFSSYNGTITADGFIGSHYAADSTLLLNAATGAVNLNGTVKGHVIPSANETYDLGSSSYKFRDLYLSGSSIKLGAATITASGSTVNLPAGSTVNGVAIGTGTGTGDGVVAGMNYNINIVGDDSTIMLNARTRAITAAGGFTGNVTGNLTGNVSGNVTGNVNGDVTGDVFTNYIQSTDSSDIVVNNRMKLISDLVIDGEIQGDLVGDVSGNITGNLYGSLYTINNTKAYDRDINAFYPNGIIFAAGSSSSITSLAGFVDIDVQQVILRGNQDIALRSGSINFTRNLAYSGASPWVQFSQYHNSADAENITFSRARGTESVPLVTQSGDDIIDLACSGYDGTSFVPAGAISMTVDGAVSTNTVPTRITLSTMSSSGTLAERLRINSSKVTFSVIPQVPTYASEAAANTAVGTPANGMIFYDSTAGKLKGYAGGVWNLLH